MTVRELITKLQRCNPDSQAVIEIAPIINVEGVTPRDGESVSLLDDTMTQVVPVEERV
jgi:hypothetical protein